MTTGIGTSIIGLIVFLIAIAVAWFLISMAISFADTLATGYLMAIVVGFALSWLYRSIACGSRPVFR